MRDSLSQSAPLRTACGFWVRAGLITLTVGATVGFGATVSLAAEGSSTAAPAGNAADETLEEIIVTARKRSENLRDIPASISAIPDTVIKEAHMTQLDDIGSMVSNLNIFEAHDNSPAVTMRGVGAFEVVQGVGFYANDVQLFEGQTVRPNDIARIEVLKGPQGTLYGGANIGGAIKYVTKEPTTSWQNEATVELGQYRTWNLEGVLSGPITDKLGVRASVYDDNHNGYI
jgi:iron complex outermembrane receptor protein